MATPVSITVAQTASAGVQVAETVRGTTYVEEKVAVEQWAHLWLLWIMQGMSLTVWLLPMRSCSLWPKRYCLYWLECSDNESDILCLPWACLLTKHFAYTAPGYHFSDTACEEPGIEHTGESPEEQTPLWNQQQEAERFHSEDQRLPHG